MIRNIFLFCLLVLSPFSLFLVGFFDVFHKVTSFESEIFLSALNKDFLFSLYVTIVSTLISCFVGAFLSFIIVLKKGKDSNSRLFKFIIFMPHLAFAYLLYLFLSPTGFISRAIYPFLNMSDFFIVNDSYGIGITIHYVLKETVFVFLFLLSSQSRVDQNLVRSSYSLGASRLATFFKIYLPIKKSSLLSVSIIIFAYCLGSYEAPYILGTNTPKMIAVSIYENFQSIESIQNQIAFVQTLSVFIISAFFSIWMYLFLGSKK